MKSSLNIGDGQTGLEIAIIGMAGRFPGANDIEQFWRNLREGVEAITCFTDEELLAAGVEANVLNDPNYVKARGVLEGADLFDASFFGYSPREAEIIDPQQRVFLECAWQALETAGYDSAAYRKPVGVYAGVGMNTYAFNLLSHPELIQTIGNFQVMTSNDKDYLPTRVSYKLNLIGPSVNIQTACSTSLVAVHFACQGLLSGECEMALAGGVSVAFPQTAGYVYQPEGIASPDGHCRTFDEQAQGTVGGHGVGVVVLKRLADALSDGDHIWAIIKSSAINNDGSRKVGYTAPSTEGQAQVIKAAHAVAGVSAGSISYVEAHGTATPLGDPIEVAALTQAFRAAQMEPRSCALGSVKTNVGHLDVAAGVAGLIKTVLSLEHELLPPSLHFKQSNSRINFADGPFFVNDKLTPWPRGPRPRYAGVSSFGIGGTNAHVILEEAPVPDPTDEGRPWQLLLLSAKSSTALDAVTANLATHLEQHPELNLADVAYTCAVGRRAFEKRRFVVCKDVGDAATVLAAGTTRRIVDGSHSGSEPAVAFMFPGQGAQHIGMGVELYQLERVFRERVDECCEILKSHLHFDLREILYKSERESAEAERRLRETSITQPALFVTEYALAHLWMSWGVRPASMIGHSIGEYVAACLAGVFTLEDALMLVAARGRLMQAMPSGAMMAVPLAETELRSLIDGELSDGELSNGKLSLAAVNAPSSCVVSGSYEMLSRLEETMTGKGLEFRRLDTSHAFHSAMMEPVLGPFVELVSRFRLSAPRIPFISNLTGRKITEQEATDPNYWAQHLRETVRFADGIGELLQEEKLILLEVGPGSALSSLAKQHPAKSAGHAMLSSLPHAADRTSEFSHLLGTLGKVWLAGKSFSSGFYANERRRRIPLPTYPFERQRFWVDAGSTELAQDFTPDKTAKRSDIDEWFYLPTWKQSLPPGALESEGDAETETSHDYWIFADELGLSAEVVKQLHDRGERVVTISSGEQFRRVGEDAYEINSRSRQSYDELIRVLMASGRKPRRILHLWSVTVEQQGDSRESTFEEAQWRGYYSLLYLAQALAASGGGAMEICVVTNNLHAVAGTESIRPEKATVLGPCRVIPQEYTNLVCRNIDIEVPERWTTQARTDVAAQIVAELKATDLAAKVVAYRGWRRWLQTFDPIRLGKRETRLREHGVYLVTGATGGVGRTLASYLARTAHARLVLVSRTAPKDKWLQELESLGAEVLWVAADVANENEMAKAVQAAQQTFGGINGLVHAAGLAGDAATVAIAETGLAESERQFNAKVYGLFTIEKVLRESNLDFRMVVSSLSSVLGGLGFAGYAAANLFADAFVHQQNHSGNKGWVTVNWDAWHFADDHSSTPAILPTEGAEVFQRILQTRGVPQFVVSTTDLQSRIDRWVNLAALTETRNAQTLYARPDLASDYEAPRDNTEQAIADIWQALLGIDSIGIHDDFFALGGHSLLATQLISRIRDTFQIELSVRKFFEAPTIASLAELVHESIAQRDREKLERVLEEIELLSKTEVDASLASYSTQLAQQDTN
jgi:acyl transferase domain-containing protein/acyl carrier protein